MTAEVTEMLFTVISYLHRRNKLQKTCSETEVRGSLISVLIHLCQWSLQREQIPLEFTVLVQLDICDYAEFIPAGLCVGCFFMLQFSAVGLWND